MQKEKQHYIPKFYLRHFSCQKENKQIGVFNMKTNFFIAKARLKTQGYKPFFYGKDGGIENALAEIESQIAPLFSSIRKTPATFPFDDDLRLRILHFVLLMAHRNPNASDNIIESEKQMRAIYREISQGQMEIDEPSISPEEAVELALKNVTMWTTFCADLKMKLLLNKTATPFVTSDNPVIQYNQFLEQRKWPLSHRGYANIGLQIFFPLCPQLTILFYDGAIYKVGDKKKNYIEISSASEVAALNRLQFLNADSLVFFNERATQDYINGLALQSKKFSKASQPETKVMPLFIKQNEFNKEDQLIVQRTTDCRSKLVVNGIVLTKKAKSHQLNASAAQIRRKAEGLMDVFGFNQLSKYNPKVKSSA